MSRGLVAAAVAVGLAMVTSASQAQLADLSPFATLEQRYDDNVFRVRNAAEARTQTPDGNPRLGDASRTLTAGLTGEFNPGLQRVVVTGQWSRTQFRAFDQLDHNAYRGVAGWAWQYRRLADGELGVDVERQLKDYAGSNDSRPALVSTREYRAVGGLNISPRWRSELSLVADSRRTSDAADTSFDLDTFTVDLAGLYTGDPVARVGVGLAHTTAEYPRRQGVAGGVLADAYDETTLEGRLRYTPSGLSDINAALGYTRTQLRPVAGRDTRGVTGRISYRRAISGRTSGQLRVYRRVRAAEFENANLVVDSGAVIRLDWAYSVKTAVALEYEARRLDYRDAAGLGGSAPPREDDQRLASLEITWQPLERLGVVLTGTYEDRGSNQPDEAFDVAIASLALRIGY